jgi:hypothetical protein
LYYHRFVVLHVKHKKLFEQNFAKNAKTNPKKIWSYIRSKTKYKPGIPDIQISPEQPKKLTTTDMEKANTLLIYFESVFIKEPAVSTPPIAARNYKEPVNIDITPEIVCKKLQKLNIKVTRTR